MSTRTTLASLVAAAALSTGMARAQDVPVPSQSPPVIEVEAGRSDHLVRDDLDTASFSLELDGWDLGLSYATEAPDFLEERQRFSLSVAKQFTNQRLAATARFRTGEEDAFGAHVLWEHGLPGTRRFGVEGAFSQMLPDEFILPQDVQGHLRLFYTTPKGLEFSIFGSQQGTPDLVNGGQSFIALPRSTLVGRQTLADVNIGEDVVENAFGARIGSSTGSRTWNAYVKSGEQFLRGVPEADKFTALGGMFRNDGKRSFIRFEVDARQAESPVSQYNEARLFLDSGIRMDGFEAGVGMYGRGISTELDQSTLLDFYQTAGGGFRTAFRVADGKWLSLWGMIEDNAPSFHRVIRAGTAFRFGEYEFGVGARRDSKGMPRFATETDGLFLTFDTPFGHGLVGQQDGEIYGDLSLRIARTKKGEEPRELFLGDKERGFALLPGMASHMIDPLSESKIDVEWERDIHSGTLFTRRSRIVSPWEGEEFLSSDIGATYALGTHGFQAEASFFLREIPSLDFSQPAGHAAVMYDFGRFDLGVGWLRDYPLLVQGRDARFAFMRMPLGEYLRLENAVGLQDDAPFISFMLSLPTSRPAQRDLLPRHLLPAVASTGTGSGPVALELPGAENLLLNVHNGGAWSADQMRPYLERYRDGWTGIRTSPAAFSQCGRGDLVEPCASVPKGSDPMIDLALRLFGDRNYFLVDLDLNDRPEDALTPELVYQMMTDLLRYDDRIRIVQCLGEPLNSGNISPEKYGRIYLPACRRAVDDVNRERPEHRKAFLMDAAAFGATSGIREKWRTYMATGAWNLADIVTCNIYGETADEAVRFARECKAIARNKPLAYTETNAIVRADNANLVGGASSYSKHRWWLEDVTERLETIALEGVPPDKQWMVGVVFYTATGHAESQYNLLDTNTLQPTSDAHQVIEQRAEMIRAAQGQSTAAPASSAIEAGKSIGYDSGAIAPTRVGRRDLKDTDLPRYSGKIVDR